VQSSSQIITTNKPTSSFFYRPDALPVAQPTMSKHESTEGKNIKFHGLAYPISPGGLPTLSLTTNSSWLPWERDRKKRHIFAPIAGARSMIFPKLYVVIEDVEIIKKIANHF